MKKLLHLILTMLILTNIGALADRFEWGASAGTVNHDIVNTMARDKDGNLFYGGEFAGTINFGNNVTLTSTHPTIADLYIAKYDSNGNIKWAFKGIDKFYDAVKKIVVDNDGNLIIFGHYQDTLKIGGKQINGGNAFLAKLNNNKEIEWIKNIEGHSYDVLAFFLGVDKKNNILLCTNSWSTMKVDGMVYGGDCCGNNNIFKFSTDGDILHYKLIEAVPGRTWPNILLFDKSNNIYLGGTAIYQINLENFEVLGSDRIGLILKMDENLNEKWVRIIEGIHYESIDCMAFDNEQNLIISGYVQSGMVDFGGQYLSDSRYIAKYDVNNNLIWLKSTTSAYTEILIDKNGNYVLKQGNYYDTYDRKGNFVSTFSFPFTIQHTVKDCNDNYYFAGIFAGQLNLSDSIKLTSQGLNDVYLTKYKRATPLYKPFIEYPQNGDTIYYKRINVNWTGLSCNNKSQIQLSAFQNFSTKILDSILTNNRVVLTVDSIEKYYFRVRNIDGTDTSAWSDVLNFYTKLEDDYERIQLGLQKWMTKNLDVVTYRNGDTIPYVPDSSTWANLKTGAWCYYQNDSVHGAKYGKLYNWYAVNDPRGLAPIGWRVPSDDDWIELEKHLGLSQIQADSAGYRGTNEGGMLKDTTTIDWPSPNEGASNITGFTALPSGNRDPDGKFANFPLQGYWWSSTYNNSNAAWIRFLGAYYSQVGRGILDKNAAIVVRCIIDDGQYLMNPPTLLNPSNNVTNLPKTANLKWQKISNAIYYTLQLDTSLSFTNPILNLNLTDTSYSKSGLSINKTYYWRAKAVNVGGESDWSTVWNFTTIASEAVPSSWDFTDFTGSNSTVLIPKNINPKIDNRDFQVGDAVGFFYTRNGALVCAGYGVWNNANMAVTVWGDDSETEIKDGFASNEGYTIKIWDGQLGKEMNSEFTVASGNAFYTTNGFTTLATLKGVSTTTQAIYLKTGWNLMSSYVIPTNDSLENIWRNLNNKLVIAKNNGGQVYIPSYEINTIGKWKHKEAYQTYLNSADTLKVSGLAANPSNENIIINSGWNLVSYLRSSAKDIEECLTTLTESASLTIAKNNAGQVYIPSYEINSIGNMLPGQGYQMYLSKKDTLVYPANGAGRTAPSDITPMAKYILPEYTETGNSAVLLLEIEGTNGDEIAVYNQNNQVIGSGVINKNKAAVTLWGDNERTSEIDGATINDKLRIMNYDYKTGRMSEVNISGLLDVVNGNNIYELNYSKDAFFVAKAKVVDNSSNLSMLVNPNPANDYIEITLEGESKYSTLMIFSNNGKQIADLTSELLTLSGNKLRYNTTNLTSGTYNLILNNGTDKIIKQIMIVK